MRNSTNSLEMFGTWSGWWFLFRHLAGWNQNKQLPETSSQSNQSSNRFSTPTRRVETLLILHPGWFNIPKPSLWKQPVAQSWLQCLFGSADTLKSHRLVQLKSIDGDGCPHLFKVSLPHGSFIIEKQTPWGQTTKMEACTSRCVIRWISHCILMSLYFPFYFVDFGFNISTVTSLNRRASIHAPPLSYPSRFRWSIQPRFVPLGLQWQRPSCSSQSIPQLGLPGLNGRDFRDMRFPDKTSPVGRQQAETGPSCPQLEPFSPNQIYSWSPNLDTCLYMTSPQWRHVENNNHISTTQHRLTVKNELTFCRTETQLIFHVPSIVHQMAES